MHDQHANPKSDIEIAQEVAIRPILDVARERLGIDPKDLLLYGHHKAKISLDICERWGRPNAVADSSPRLLRLQPGKERRQRPSGWVTPQQAGKAGLLCLLRTELGPCFGAGRGCCGRRLLQSLMEDINLHFTGDFHASVANNCAAWPTVLRPSRS
jgi:formate--tetrahydrofolate ligase